MKLSIANGVVTDHAHRGGKRKPKLRIRNDREFIALAEKLDAELIEEKTPITARPILAGCKLTERFDISLSLTLPHRAPIRGVYDETEISIRLHQWFEQRYGARLGVPFSIGCVAFPLRGDFYAVDCPMSFGTVEFVCEPRNWRREHSAWKRGGCNMIDLVQDLTPDLAHSFTGAEVVKLGAAVVQGLATFSALRDIEDIPLVNEIRGDYDAAVFHLVSNDRNPGLSKWASLQATEKTLKAFIASKNYQYANTHNLQHLVNRCVLLGLPQPSPHYVGAVACAAGVRYGEIPVSPKEALLAHLVSLEMGDVAARCTAQSLGRSVTQVSEPLIDDIPLGQFLQQQGVATSGPFDLS